MKTPEYKLGDMIRFKSKKFNVVELITQVIKTPNGYEYKTMNIEGDYGVNTTNRRAIGISVFYDVIGNILDRKNHRRKS